jgi:hypothetical protein
MSENGRHSIEFIYDPCGVIDVQHLEPAARVTEVDGMRLGVLSNTKWNAAKLLRATVRALESRGVALARVHHYDKEHFSKDAASELIAQIAAENDIALTAIGDCGSCTSSCVNDAVRLEQSGVPTAVIVTSEFEHEAQLQREARGMAALRPVVVTHPISSLTLEQLDQRAADAAPQARAIWTGAEVTEAICARQIEGASGS